MGIVLGSLGDLGYGWSYRVLDSQWFGVPQRRRRVFIVGRFGDAQRAAQVLFEPESLPWDSPPSREAKKRTSRSVAACLNSGGNDGGFRTGPGEHIVTHTLKAEGYDASEDGTGRGVPLVPIAFQSKQSASSQHPSFDEVSPTLDVAKAGGMAVAFGGNNVCGTLQANFGRKQGLDDQHVNNGCPMFVMQERMEAENPNSGPGGKGWSDDGVAFTLEARHRPQSTAGPFGVRRLTPTECERLQGFPDDWTLYGADGEQMSDSARYRMLGNAVTVNVAEWIGRRNVETHHGPA